MADCFPPEADDLHRRWLPQEIFVDTGIIDTEAVADVPAEAGIVGVEDLTAQLVGILGGRAKVCSLAPPPSPPTATKPASSLLLLAARSAKSGWGRPKTWRCRREGPEDEIDLEFWTELTRGKR